MPEALAQECTNYGRHIAIATIFCRGAPLACWFSVIDLASCHASVAQNFEVDRGFLQNLYTPGLACCNCTHSSQALIN
jgi:hypothetical protein